MVGDQLQRADHLVLVVQWGADEVPDPAADELLLDRGPVRVRRQVVDDDGAILDDGPLVERPRELGGRVVGGAGEDARLLMARGVVQDEDAVSLHGRETEAQLGAPEERPELRLQPLEVRVRHDRILVDEIALERGQHLLVGDVHGLHDHEAAQHEPLGRQELEEQITVDGAGLQALPRRLRERRLRPDQLDPHEAPVELQPEVLIQPRRGIGGREDHGDVAADVDAVGPLENQGVGEQAPRGGQRLLHAVLLQEVRAALERSVRVHERAPEGGGGVEGAELEWEQSRAVLLLPKGRRKQGAHHQVNEGAVLLDDRQVVDAFRQLRGRARLLAHETRDRSAAELVVGGELCPEGDQRGQAELASERKCRRIRTRRRPHGGRFAREAVHRGHDRILPSGQPRAGSARAPIRLVR